MAENKYIGGEFTSEDLPLKEKGDNSFFFPIENQSFYETGADALASILSHSEELEIVLWVPVNFCYDTLDRVKNKVRDKLIEVKIYSTLEDLELICSKNEFILFVHFNRYDEKGQQAALAISKSKKSHLIEDFVQAPLDIAKYVGDAAFNSFRKFIPLELSVCYSKNDPYNGSYQESSYFRMKKEAAHLKAEYLKNYNSDFENSYLRKFKEAELLLLDDRDIRFAQKKELDNFKKIFFHDLLNVRRKNYDFLKDKLKGIIKVIPGNYMYFMVSHIKRDALRRSCFSQGIFPAIHWLDSGSELSKEILSFHIDHRYDKEDMERIVNIITTFES